MASRNRRRGRPVKGPATQHSLATQLANVSTHGGFLALANEIYLEIVSHIPSVPIPTPDNSSSYGNIRRIRHETLLSLSQTCRSLRRVFWRYLWQRIEVREGMKVDDTTTLPSPSVYPPIDYKDYTVELVRQLEIVTIRNPQLAQYVNYLDVFLGDYLFDSVLNELARCLSLFPNLHTVQIDVTLDSRRSLGKVFERTFKKYSYSQIRNVYVMSLSKSLLASCPNARRVGFTPLEQPISHDLRSPWHTSNGLLCCETLEDFQGLICTNSDTCKFIVNSFPNLRHITIRAVSLSFWLAPQEACINSFTMLNQLQSITIIFEPFSQRDNLETRIRSQKEVWIKNAKQILLAVQCRDKLEKFLTLIGMDIDSETRIIALKPFKDSSEILAV